VYTRLLWKRYVPMSSGPGEELARRSSRDHAERCGRRRRRCSDVVVDAGDVALRAAAMRNFKSIGCRPRCAVEHLFAGVEDLHGSTGLAGERAPLQNSRSNGSDLPPKAPPSAGWMTRIFASVHAEHAGELAVQVVHHLGGAPQRELPVRRPRGQRAVRLDRGVGGARVVPLALRPRRPRRRRRRRRRRTRARPPCTRCRCAAAPSSRRRAPARPRPPAPRAGPARRRAPRSRRPRARGRGWRCLRRRRRQRPRRRRRSAPCRRPARVRPASTG
jgi:hypothetical protein